MSVRTVRETLTFTHPFSLAGTDEVQPPGTYTVQTDDELIEGLSFLAYRRVATVILVPMRGRPGSLQAITVDPRELQCALGGDRSETERPAVSFGS